MTQEIDRVFGAPADGPLDRAYKAESEAKKAVAQYIDGHDPERCSVCQAAGSKYQQLKATLRDTSAAVRELLALRDYDTFASVPRTPEAKLKGTSFRDIGFDESFGYRPLIPGILKDRIAEADYIVRDGKKQDGGKLRADLIPWDVVDFVVDSKAQETDIGRALNDLFYKDEQPTIKLTHETLKGVARVLEMGARKYSARGWEKGIEASRVYAAAKRHLLEEGTASVDSESGLLHFYHEVCNLLFLARFTRDPGRYAAFDDRPRPFVGAA